MRTSYSHYRPQRFADHATVIRSAVGATALRIEHIGSTAVPGLAAKPIIDILLVVPDAGDEASYLPALEAAGYQLRVREPAFHQHRMLRTPERDVHIHVFPPDSSEIDRYLCFRNRLRSDATDRRHYEATKGRLAAQDWPDMNAYAEAKGAVVEQIMANGGGTPRTGTAAPATGTAAIAIRPLTSADPAIMAKAFAAIGWNKPQELFERYLAEQDSGKRVIVVAYAQQRFAGYVTLFLRPDYRYLQDRVIPEVRDFNVLPQLRHRGIGAALMDAIEAEAARHSDLLGISVGLHADYGAAQRMYVQRGYVPDGRGLIHAGRVVAFNVPVPNDDDLVIAFTKRLR